MIDSITITYTTPLVQHTMSCRVDDNIPYTLAEMFSELIRRTDANESMVIDELIQEFNYNPQQ